MANTAAPSDAPAPLGETNGGISDVTGLVRGITGATGSALGVSAPAGAETSAREAASAPWYASAAEEERLVSETRALAAAAGDARAASADAFWVLACLRARKGSAERAAARLRALVAWRGALRMEDASVRTKTRAFLERGVMICTGARDRSGRHIINGRLRRTDPANFSALDVVRGIALVIEWCLRTYPDSQNCGLVFCSDFGGAGLGNLDPRVPGEMSHAFGQTLPVRVAGMFAMNLPWFIRPVFAIVAAVMSRKIKGRVRGISRSEELAQHFEPASVLRDAGMGGTLEWSDEMNQEWVERVMEESASWPSVSTISADQKEPDRNAPNN